MNAVFRANQIYLKDEMVVLGLFSIISGLTGNSDSNSGSRLTIS
jgi:hypothetical protein